MTRRDPNDARRDRRRAIPEEPGSGPAPYRPTPAELEANWRERERNAAIERARSDVLAALEELIDDWAPADVERHWLVVSREMRGRRHPDDGCAMCWALRDQLPAAQSDYE